MNKYLSYFGTIVLLLIAGYLYEKFKIRNMQTEEMKDYELVRKYLINDMSSFSNINSLNSDFNSLPILWIHIDYKINAREWLDFYSRNTDKLNQPYLHFTLQSIRKHCNSDFRICLINDDSFYDLIPNWNINLNHIGDPLKEKVRELAICKLLYIYGGFRIPINYICFKNLYPMYKNISHTNNILTSKLTNMNEYINYYPSSLFLACNKENHIIKEYCAYLENIISSDYTSESVFLNKQTNWFYNYSKQHNEGILYIPSELIGVVDIYNKQITIERLLGNTEIEFNKNVYGILLPNEQFLNRTKYGWINKLSTEELLESNTILGKLLYI